MEVTFALSDVGLVRLAEHCRFGCEGTDREQYTGIAYRSG